MMRMAWNRYNTYYRYSNCSYCSFFCSPPIQRQDLSTSFFSSFSKDSRIVATQKWFETVVIGEKLCPFAPPFLQQPSRLRILVVPTTTMTTTTTTTASAASLTTNNQTTPSEDPTTDLVRMVATEVQLLVGENATPPHETTLIVLDYNNNNGSSCANNNTPSVANFRDFIRLSWLLQEKAIGEEFIEKVQIVLFHPQATHQTYSCTNEDNANPADYTIRSPFPTIHLLRQVDVLRAVQSSGYSNLESLPARNQQKLIQQGLESCVSRLNACYVHENHNRME